jgi:hypothetical protein
MKRLIKISAAVLLLAGLTWGYFHRERACVYLSSFASEKKIRYHDAKYARSYREAKEAPEKDQPSLRSKIRWDLWCIAMRAEIKGPKEKDGMLFYRVDATDRTDTECIYVFSADGTLIEVAWVPLA